MILIFGIKKGEASDKMIKFYQSLKKIKSSKKNLKKKGKTC